MKGNKCNNKWCSYQTNTTPACATVDTLYGSRASEGGLTGRGVTICPFGYLDRVPPNGKMTIRPYLESATPTDTYFQPDRPGFLPPQGDPRPLWRIGYQWRN